MINENDKLAVFDDWWKENEAHYSSKELAFTDALENTATNTTANEGTIFKLRLVRSTTDDA